MVPIRQILLPALLFLSIVAKAQKKEPVLFLKEGPVKTVYNITDGAVEGFNSKAVRHQNRTFAVLQFQSLPSAETRNYLSKQGIELLQYIPENAYTVSITGKLNAGVLKRAGARTLFSLAPKHKMHPILAKGEVPVWAKRGTQAVDLWISFPRTYTAAEVIGFLKEEKVEVISTEQQSYRVLGVRLTTDRLEELAAYPFVEYVEPVPPPDKEFNENSRNASRAGVLQASTANGGKGLDGEGVVIGIGDNGDVQTHMDLSGPRVINKVYTSPISHATHVHATAAGAGIINELYKGYAPKATVISQFFSGIISNTPAYVQDYGMVITNNSYGGGGGCGYYGGYNLISQMLDQHAFDYPHLQHVFAAGNDGWNSCAPYPAGYHTTFGGYQAAKNVLTVGATDWAGGWSGNSSRGPVQDGRTKPEITAMGGAVYSATLNNGYTHGWGTSFASPAVAGGMALLYQKYRQMYGGQNPKSGLMKALMCNGGADLGNKGPDFQYGFGWMHLLRSVEMLEKEQYKIGSITNGATQNHTVTVPANTAQLKVMLYWTDPPASPLSSHALVNDLDLTVINPSALTTLPKKLDTAATGMLNVATTGADHINNMEQVVIDNPSAGTYSINIAALVAQNPSQEYFVVYDIVPVSTRLTYPAGGEGLVPGEGVQISWDSYGEPVGTFTLKYSTDNGSTWTDINTAVDAAARYLWWTVPNTPTGEALIRIERNGTAIGHTSQPFTIIGVPALSLSPVQCEGYVSLDWTDVAGATDYEVMMVKGNEFVSVGTTASTNYTFKGLNKDSTYWLSVRARVNGKTGRRAVAISRMPKDGTCSGAISNSDLVLDSLIAPKDGRKYTSKELGTSAVTVRIKNLDDEPVSGFTVKYQLANNAWVSESVGATIAAGGTYDHTFSKTEDFTGVGNYPLVVIVNNQSPDPVSTNDSLFNTIRHLDNRPIDLSVPFLDNIESAVVGTYVGDTMGLAGVDRYDFTDTSGLGRLRTYISAKDAYSGTKALILDAVKYLQGTFPTIAVTGTFNLGAYKASINDIRLTFKGRNGFGILQGSRVWVRGNDSQSWQEVFDYRNINSQSTTPSIEIADTLNKYGQDFSSSFQIKWSFRPRGRATENLSGTGLWLDDINLYEAIHDMQMLRIDSPVNISCGLSGNVPLKVQIRNSSNTTLFSVPVRYSVNGGPWVSEIIASVAANTTMAYNFTTPLNFTASGLYSIKAIVDFPTDNVRLNDTLLVSVHNAPLVSTFPYLENFEGNEGGWYTLGSNASWQYGTPASPRINKAASGTKAWKTNLTGNYNDGEYSYLYSPCFQIGSMTAPTLSFSMAMDLEDCGSTMCDAAWVEYSTDNTNWQRLMDTASAGTNWYTRSGPPYWSNQGYTRWHVATMGLPRGVGNIRLRLVMWSDEAVNMEGIAIDDIHVYDSSRAIYNGASPSITATQPVSGNSWVHFESDGKLVASIKPNGQNLGNTEVQAFIHSGAVRNSNQQYYHNRNITIKPQTSTLSDSVAVRMYFLDSESEALLAATGCSDCTKPASAYELGVSKYSDPDKSKENGELCDNSKANNWSFIGGRNVVVVPFLKGYYIEFKVKDFSEFWLNNGGTDLKTPLFKSSVPALAPVCVDAAPVSLAASPVGGTWNGLGVSGSFFDPSIAGAGTHTLSYSFVSSNGCTAVATTDVTVNPLPQITMPAKDTICVDASSVNLVATPAGGVWSGAGVSGATFQPSVAGTGAHTLSYTLSSGNGCTAVGTTAVTVNALPVVTMPTFPAVEFNAPPVTLTGAQPTGGTWSGKGVSNGVFTPATAGAGTHTLSYSYSDDAGCSAQGATTITVKSIPVKLTNFSVERTGVEDVRANWTIEKEVAILRYELELAKGDEAMTSGQFVKIGEVAARGSSASVEQYSFTDAEPLKSGRRHYRLKVMAADGSFTYSEIRMVEFPLITWRIYPNPSSGKFFMTYQLAVSEQLEANVYDAKGRLVKQYRKPGSGALQRLEVDLSPSSFASGVYMMQTVVNGRKEFFKLHKL